MKRRDEILVGATILAALAVLVAAVIWLSEAQLGVAARIYTARFRNLGNLGVGDPVVLRGVRVGRIAEIRLAEGNWVETEIQIYDEINLPANPAVIAASASLFGEWQAGIVDFDDPPSDPTVREELEQAAAAGDDAWPGAALPDIGQLTAQAGRIASDIQTFSSRIETAFDEEAVENLQSSIRDFGDMASEINEFASDQTDVLSEATGNITETSDLVARAARNLQQTMSRIDSATSEGELDSIIQQVQTITSDLQAAATQFQELVAVFHANQSSLERVITGADSLMTRLQEGSGTLGLLVGDSVLYMETASAIQELRALVADIKANPRKYFKFSVF